MPVIWGLDLKEITWSKFGSKNMWTNHYHLRRTKLVVYQLAMIFCVVSESLGTAALSDYLDQSEWIRHLNPEAIEYNGSYVGIGSYNIFAGVFVAFVFGAAFFFDLIWPERHESPGVRLAWRVCSILAVIFHGASAFALTIITARNEASLKGVSDERWAYLLTQAKPSPLKYRENGRAIAAVVFIWPGWLFVIASTVILWLSMADQDRSGTAIAAHARNTKSVENGNNFALTNGAEKEAVIAPTANGVTTNGQPLAGVTGPTFGTETTAAIDGIRRT